MALSATALSTLTTVATAASASSSSNNTALQNMIYDLESLTDPALIAKTAQNMLGMGIPGVAGIVEHIVSDCGVVDPTQRRVALQSDFQALQALATINANSGNLITRLLNAL